MAADIAKIDELIARAVAWRANPKVECVERYNLLVAFREAMPASMMQDELQVEIDTLASDLNPDIECLACGDDCRGACDQQYRDHVSWGMTSPGNNGGVWA